MAQLRTDSAPRSRGLWWLGGDGRGLALIRAHMLGELSNVLLLFGGGLLCLLARALLWTEFEQIPVLPEWMSLLLGVVLLFVAVCMGIALIGAGAFLVEVERLRPALRAVSFTRYLLLAIGGPVGLVPLYLAALVLAGQGDPWPAVLDAETDSAFLAFVGGVLTFHAGFGLLAGVWQGAWMALALGSLDDDQIQAVTDDMKARERQRALAPAPTPARPGAGGAKTTESVGQYPARRLSRTEYNLSQVLGMKETKRRMLDAVDRFETEGGNGLLLFGPPGTGKTWMVENLAGELGYRLLYARGTELISKWVGQTTEQINQIASAARAQAPCVLFFDEIDSLLPSRDGLNNQDQRTSVNALLTTIADLNRDFARHRVLVVAATNHLDLLDGAGIREGRFDVKVEVPPPDYEARLGLLRQALGRVRYDEDDLASTARRWEGFNVKRLLLVGRTAARLAQQRNRLVDAELLREALRDVQGQAGSRLSENAPSMEDLVFPPATRAQLEGIIAAMRDPEHIEQFGGRLARGAVFYGPPGTGKTAVAQALAKASEWAFLPTSGQALLADPQEIDRLMDKARNLRPTIVFIDEAESVLADRTGSPHSRDVTNKLLAQMDGPKALHDVFFIAATNHPDMLDEAMLRWGRFSEHLDFTPDEGVVREITRRFIADHQAVQWAGDVERFVQRFPRVAPADLIGGLTRLISQAALRAGRDARSVVVDLDQVEQL